MNNRIRNIIKASKKKPITVYKISGVYYFQIGSKRFMEKVISGLCELSQTGTTNKVSVVEIDDVQFNKCVSCFEESSNYCSECKYGSVLMKCINSNKSKEGALNE